MEITVDYNRSIKEMLHAGRYFYEGFFASNILLRKKGKKISQLDVEIVHFGREMESGEAEAELEKRGFRPATLKELLAFGERYPDFQKEFPIVALQAYSYPDTLIRECDNIAVLCGLIEDSIREELVPPVYGADNMIRVLRTEMRGGDWNARCRFLAIRRD